MIFPLYVEGKSLEGVLMVVKGVRLGRCIRHCKNPNCFLCVPMSDFIQKSRVNIFISKELASQDVLDLKLLFSEKKYVLLIKKKTWCSKILVNIDVQ